GQAGGFEVGALVADRTTHCGRSETIRAALDRRLVQAALIALTRAIAGRVTVDASGMREDLAQFGEERGRALIDIGNRGKTFRWGQTVRRRFSSRKGSANHDQNADRRHDRAEELRAQSGVHVRSALMLIALASQHGPKWFNSSNAPLLDQVALRIGKNHVAHGLVIFDVAGAAAEVAIERLSNGF